MRSPAVKKDGELGSSMYTGPSLRLARMLTEGAGGAMMGRLPAAQLMKRKNYVSRLFA